MQERRLLLREQLRYDRNKRIVWSEYMVMFEKKLCEAWRALIPKKEGNPNSNS